MLFGGDFIKLAMNELAKERVLPLPGSNTDNTKLLGISQT